MGEPKMRATSLSFPTSYSQLLLFYFFYVALDVSFSIYIKKMFTNVYELLTGEKKKKKKENFTEMLVYSCATDGKV